ncbi:unnamed protein product [Dibothriocephalus latus]|uniref:Uncharacterized protein n=1 Tax=Dibothriocephalus latus TaxID=60516 RepID=A0A3P7LPD3_DIBLA|nr:unnamed protein product [Dibothriocephalus latus]
MVARYRQAGANGRAQMEVEYGKANLDQLITEYESNEVIKKECKRCPRCNAPIQVGLPNKAIQTEGVKSGVCEARFGTTGKQRHSVRLTVNPVDASNDRGLVLTLYRG